MSSWNVGSICHKTADKMFWGEEFPVAVYCCPSAIFGHSKGNKSNVAPLPQGCQWGKWAGKPGRGFRLSKEPRQKLGIWFAEDAHPNDQAWAVLLQSHLWLRGRKQLLLLGMEGRLVGGGRGDGLGRACCPPAPCLPGIHAPCSLPLGQTGNTFTWVTVHHQQSSNTSA